MSIFDIFRRLHSGVVTAKHYYSAAGLRTEALTTFNKGVNQVAVFVQPASYPEGWSLIVNGTDKSGKHQLSKEIYVDPWVWGNTSIGSSWPPTSA